MSGSSLADALDSATGAIAAAGCTTPRLDAEVLLAHVLGIGRERLLIDRELTVAGPAVRAFQQAVRRRCREREPVAYITGRRGFRHIELTVDHRALIPRPETELLVEAALSLPHGSRVLDLCTGSGAVALALKHERPDLQLTGSDVSQPALKLAALNGRRLGLQVRWLRSDLLAQLPDEFDAVVCNPPYVSRAERSQLAPEIVRHEPPLALFADADGLAVIDALFGQLADRDIGWAAIEIGAGQARRASSLASQAGFQAIELERDLAGIERVLIARRGR